MSERDEVPPERPIDHQRTDHSTSLVVDGFVYGEGPRWHGGRLWFTDAVAGAVNVVEDGRIHQIADVPRANGLGWLADGTLAVSASLEPTVTFIGDGTTVRHDLGHLAWSTNDLVALDDWVYVDLLQFTDSGMVGSIALVTRDGEARVVAAGFSLPNGLAITPDRSILLAGDSDAGRVLAFTIEDDGGLADRRVFADLPGRKPDGLCLDAEGAVWVGCYDTGEFLRVRDGGEVVERIAVSSGWAVAPALGGPDGRTLYLVIDDTTIEEFLRGESVGRIEAACVEVPGIGIY